MVMIPEEILDLLGADKRTTLCAIVAELLEGVEQTTVDPTGLDSVFMQPGPELDKLNWYHLLAAAAEVVSGGRKTIRRADASLFRTEILGPSKRLAVLPIEGAPERVSAEHTYDSLYYSGNRLQFRRNNP